MRAPMVSPLQAASRIACRDGAMWGHGKDRSNDFTARSETAVPRRMGQGYRGVARERRHSESLRDCKRAESWDLCVVDPAATARQLDTCDRDTRGADEQRRDSWLSAVASRERKGPAPNDGARADDRGGSCKRATASPASTGERGSSENRGRGGCRGRTRV